MSTTMAPPPPPTTPPPPGAWQGYTPAMYPGVTPQVRHSSHLKVIGLLGLSLALVVGVVVGVSALLTPPQRVYVCPPDCGHPPTAQPAASNPRFTGPNGAYTVAYHPSDDQMTSTHDSTSVTETLTISTGGTIRLFGTAAQGQTAQQVATALISRTFPSATRFYVIPNAVVGFQPGYGEVDDVNVQSSNGSYEHDRLVVMVAVKNDVALVGEALGPYQQSTPNSHNNGHPSGVSLEIALFFLDPPLNSFTWHGDPPR